MGKEKKKEIKKPTNSNVGISYQGNVKVELVNVKTGKVYQTYTSHNAGTERFFSAIANSIAGVDTALMMPGFVQTYLEQEGAIGKPNIADLVATSVTKVPYNSKRTYAGEEEDTYCVEFRFIIPFAQMIPDTELPGLGKEDIILLYSSQTSQDGDFLAYYRLDGEGINRDGLSNVIITWTMTIANRD